MNMPPNHKKFDCIHSKCLIRNDSILEIHIKSNFYFTLAEVKEITKNILEKSNGSNCMALIILEEYATCDLEVIKYIASTKSFSPFIAFAIVTNFLPQVILVTHIINRNPILSTRLFDEKKDAETWLHSIEKTN